MAQRVVRMGTVLLALAVAGCADDSAPKGYEAFERDVSQNRLGSQPDTWIEIKNLSGEWEKTGLIFGYVNDYEECQKAIAGLKAENYAREYRCSPAN
ncbi:hypothetical protein GV829_07485 [Sphingomonas lacunae]|uniref:Lipoprotein n=1 Tax=Sphingomonas lacunae TaxID=2698828 RepID=A0A6M4AV68_9SPHN|nr:hypothetical protein [Sphingomonas lacunae]QJQ32310.1 hypothetical protein GV829_07485 [Sphingomonas lacunae]